MYLFVVLIQPDRPNGVLKSLYCSSHHCVSIQIQKHKKALSSLQNGIDFVIDDVLMEKKFYAEILNAYKGLGDAKNITKYQNKL